VSRTALHQNYTMPTYIKRGGKWRVQIRKKGVSKSGTFYTKAEAREWATQIEREIDTGKIAKRSTATLEEAFKRYAKEESPKKRGSRWEKVRLGRLQRDPLADIRFKDLTVEHLAKWRDKRSQEVTAGSVNRELTLIRSVLKQARLVWGWIDDDIMKDVSRLTPPPPRDRRITDDEIRRVCLALGYDGAVRNNSHETAVAFLLALETGMRLGEICSFKKNDVHGRFIRLHRTKNADRRDVPLSKEAVRLIGLLPDGEFTVSSAVASTLFRRARINAEILDLTFHDSRHEACTRLAQKLPLPDLARMLGIRDWRTLRVYYNASPEEIAAILDSFDPSPTDPPGDTGDSAGGDAEFPTDDRG